MNNKVLADTPPIGETELGEIPRELERQSKQIEHLQVVLKDLENKLSSVLSAEENVTQVVPASEKTMTTVHGQRISDHTDQLFCSANNVAALIVHLEV